MKLFRLFLLSILICENINHKAHAAMRDDDIYEQTHSADTASEKTIPEEWFAAVVHRDVETLKKLADKVDVNVVDKGFQLPALILATADHPSEEIVKFLLARPGIDVNILDYIDRSALMWASEKGLENIVKLLLQAPNIDVNIKDRRKNTALTLAVQCGRENIVKLLVQVPNIDVNTNSPLLWVKDKSIAKLLLEVPGINLNAQNKRGQSAMELAESRNLHNIYLAILDKRRQLAQLAYDAIRQHSLEALQPIIEQIGVDNIVLFGTGNTLIDVAFETNQPDIIFYLLQKSKDPQELLARFPFETISPSSPIFEYFIKLAYGEHNIQKDSAPTKICRTCAKQDCKKRCAHCKKVYYCSPECQKADWKIHKPNCKS